MALVTINSGIFPDYQGTEYVMRSGLVRITFQPVPLFVLPPDYSVHLRDSLKHLSNMQKTNHTKAGEQWNRLGIWTGKR